MVEIYSRTNWQQSGRSDEALKPITSVAPSGSHPEMTQKNGSGARHRVITDGGWYSIDPAGRVGPKTMSVVGNPAVRRRLVDLESD